MSMNSTIKEVLKNGVRPYLIPIFRTYIRYFPIHQGKRFIWQKLIEPYIQSADYPYIANTLYAGVIAGNTSDFIQRFIYYFGIWEPALTYWVRRRIKPGDVFIDIGANIGYYTLLASKLVGKHGKVISIEASPRIFESLKNNLARNYIQNVKALNLAVSDSEGTVKVYFGGHGNCGETSILEQVGMEFEGEVKSIRLDTILISEELDKIRIVKIDVEGAEFSVVDGMHELLHKCPKVDVLIEINPERLATQGKTAESIFKIFEQAGYYAYSLENSYSPLSYLTPKQKWNPSCVLKPIMTQMDIVFTRDEQGNN